jgi:hypothetical protein
LLSRSLKALLVSTSIGRDFRWFSGDPRSIETNAPAASGVYAIFKPGVWIYVGESNDIQRRLLEHLRRDHGCISWQIPAGFHFEPCDATARMARQTAWIAQLRPVSNQQLRLGVYASATCSSSFGSMTVLSADLPVGASA